MREKFQCFICPIDGLPLLFNNKQLSCDSGHCFDIAKQGYVNLLSVQHKKSSAPGDSKAMVDARRRILDSGIYEPVLSQLVSVIEALKLPENSTILDAGCGEGYYTKQLARKFPQHQFIGLDISKEALKLASNKNDDIDWVVATNSHPPIIPASVDLIICIFGFHSFAGFRKILSQQGKVILVDPAEEHMLELREKLYEQVKIRAAYSIDDADENKLVLLNEQRLNFTINNLTNNQIQDMLAMTPHLFRAPSDGKNTVKNLETLNLKVDMLFRILTRSFYG